MNYYNPYFSNIPYNTAISPTRTGLFGKLFSGINFSSILSGTQKTLNIVNQAVPLIKQAQPIFQNAKTMFKVMNEFKKIETPINQEVNNNNDIKSDIVISNDSNIIKTDDSGPTFFI